MDYSKIKPVAKVGQPAIAGAVATLGWWIVVDATGWLQDPPAAVVAASVVLIGAVVGWLAPREVISPSPGRSDITDEGS